MVKFLEPEVQDRSVSRVFFLSEILMARQRSKDELNESQQKNKGNELLIKMHPHSASSVGKLWLAKVPVIL